MFEAVAGVAESSDSLGLGLSRRLRHWTVRGRERLPKEGVRNWRALRANGTAARASKTIAKSVCLTLGRADRVSLIGARLYLPEEWKKDRRRCEEVDIQKRTASTKQNRTGAGDRASGSQ